MKEKAILLIVLFVFLLSGCASFRCLDGGCQKDMQDLTTACVDLRNEVIHLTKEGKVKQSQIEALERDRNTLKTETVSLSEENKNLKLAASTMEKSAAVEKQASMKAEEKPKIAGDASKELRIKVLTGTGKISSAKTLSKKLTNMGYKVERIDRAPYSNFPSGTIFFSSQSEKKAREMAERLGKNVAVKPVTWRTVFDVIVVAGRQ